jgi:mannan endo-1,4-beta-mannosidase
MNVTRIPTLVIVVVSVLTIVSVGHAGNMGFVTTDGTRFFLNGEPFYYVGTNNYYLMVYAADPTKADYVDEVLEETALLGMKVVRTWAFNDGASQWNALQISPGVYDENVFQALDYVLAKADSLNLRLILPLVNNWDDYGGMNQYVEWSNEALGGDGFVEVDGTHFEVGGKHLYFAGVNFWSAINLASTGSGGDRARLLRELDLLQSKGITVLRIMAGSEGPDTEPWRMVPSLQTSPGVYDGDVLDGMDYVMKAAKDRNLRVVMCLNNFWPWSGGMAQYLSWNGGGPIPYPPPEPGGSWDTYADYTTGFYSNDGAKQDFRDHIDFIVNRVNPYTGLAYKNDPTIMAWELGNEPRGYTNATAMNTWIDSTAAYIKGLDPNHLVTTGCEGDTPWPSYNGLDFEANHDGPDIDYTTIHIWPQNWNWYDPTNPGTYSTAESEARSYFNSHEARAVTLDKPMVLEEFGLARDGGSYDPSAAVTYRDMFLAAMYNEVYTSASSDGPAGGCLPWAWAGEGRPLVPYGSHWSPGDPWIGDPPHEAQGWYSMYDGDTSTLEDLSDHADQMRSLCGTLQHDDFYTDATCRQYYKDHISAVLNRVNTVNGRTYKDDPTVFAWELANEPRCASDLSGDTLNDWIAEMSGYIRSIDSNHMITTGSEGFYDEGSGPWYRNGSQGVDYLRNHQVADIDFCTVHVYSDYWGFDYEASMDWVLEHIDDAHSVIGKPVILEEFGKYRDTNPPVPSPPTPTGGSGNTSTRDDYFQGFFDNVRSNDAAGSNFWILYHDDYPDYDGFGVYYPADDSTTAIIAAEAQKMNDKSQGLSTISYTGIVSLLFAVMAGAILMLRRRRSAQVKA